MKSSSDYLQKMYSEMARVDEQLEMVSRYSKKEKQIREKEQKTVKLFRIETDGGSLSGVSSISQQASEGTVQGSHGSQSR